VSSHGIKDRVAIVGMGCTKFGERWDSSTSDLLVESATEAFTSANIGKDDVDAYWLGTMNSGFSGPDSVRGVEDRLQTGHSRRELLRQRIRGLPKCLLRSGVRRL